MRKRHMIVLLFLLPTLYGFTITVNPPTTYTDNTPIPAAEQSRMIIRFYQRAPGSTGWGTSFGETLPGGNNFSTTFPGILPGQTIEVTADAYIDNAANASSKLDPPYVWTRPLDESPPPDNTVASETQLTWDWPTTLIDGTPINYSEYDEIKAYVRIADQELPLDSTNYQNIGVIIYPANTFDFDTNWLPIPPAPAKPRPGETKWFSVSVALRVGSIEKDGPFSGGTALTLPFLPANHPTNIRILRP